MSIKVLVSGVGGDVAQGVVKSLMKSSLDLKIFKTCAYYNSSWLYVDDLSFKAPLSASDEYIPFIIRLIKKFGIHVFLPCVDSEIYKISQNKDLIERETGVRVCVGDLKQINICDDKYLTFEFLLANKFKTPLSAIPHHIEDIDRIIEQVGFPLIAKKRRSQGSKDIYIINTYGEARNYIGQDDYILQEFLRSDEDEYTCGVYLGDDGKAKGCCLLRRELKNGSTYRAKRVVNSGWVNRMCEIAERLGLKYVNIQARKKGDDLYVFEFNGRFSGTTGIISRVFNAPEMYAREAILGEEIEWCDNSDDFIVMRYYEEIYATSSDIEAARGRSETI